VKGPEFSQESDYEALALEVEDTIQLLSEIKGRNGEYETALLVAICGFRISEALGLQWRDILWEKKLCSNPADIRTQHGAGGSEHSTQPKPRGSSSSRTERPRRVEASDHVRCRGRLCFSFHQATRQEAL
jgi:integrase